MDTVGDSLIRLKNGYLAFKDKVDLSYSKLVLAICTVLKKEGYIADFTEEKSGEGVVKKVVVTLRYEEQKGSETRKQPAVTGVLRVSKPGLRIYKGRTALPYVLNGLGIALISTPQGVMTDKEARKKGLGGEVMAQVW